MQIEFLGKFYDNHSLSIVNRNIAIELHKQGVELRIIPLDSFDPVFKVAKDQVKILKQLEAVIFEKPASIQLRHTYPPVWQWPEHSSTKVVYIQPWEFPKAPFEWQYKFETFADALIVPSKYCETVFSKGGMNPSRLHVVPNGYNEEVFYESDVEKDNKLRFIFVGNHQWRKGLDILLSAWVKAFNKSDNARLIVKDSPRIYGQSNILSEIVKLQYKYNCAGIEYINDDLSDVEMAELYRRSDILVHPYRAEGFGMHVQEAMACGCIPIVSANGPTEDFVSDSAGIKVPVFQKSININDPGIFATKPGDATTLMSTHTFINEPSVEHLVNAMQYLYFSHDRATIMNEMRRNKNINTWSSVAASYIKAFNAIDLLNIKRNY